MDKLYLAIGSLNREAPYFQGARGEGLSIYTFDTLTGEARRICGTASVDNPTFLSVDPVSGAIYANSEVFGWHEGTVTAYRFDAGRGELVYLNKQACQGSISAYNMVTRDRKFVLVANYAMGTGGPDQSLVALPIKTDGSLGPVEGPSVTPVCSARLLTGRSAAIRIAWSKHLRAVSFLWPILASTKS